MLHRSLFLLVVAAAPLAAQAPRITPAGDPSVRNDTIYRLAVDPAAYPDDDFVYLLDDGVVRFEADGRGTKTYRQVVQILTQEAAETWGENAFSYVVGRERLTLNWARVLNLNGEVISARPAHEQESTAPVAEGAPVYTDVRVRQVNLSGVAPGTIVDYSYTEEIRQPVMPGDIHTSWRVSTGRPTLRSRLILDLPASLTPRIQERNISFRTERVAGGRRVYTWATRDVPKVEPEPFMSDSNDADMWLEVSGPLTWTDVARWYTGLSRDRYALTPALRAGIASVVAGATTLEDSLRAVHRWVAQDFRYVSLSLGIGGYQPRSPAAVLDSRYGDCKDKATLFIAAARAMGVTAHPVLLHLEALADRQLPTVGQFDHMIAAIERPGRGYLYVDLTAEFTPYGELPPSEQGGFALVVHPDGRAEEVVLPLDSVTVNRAYALTSGELLESGEFRGWVHATVSGAQQYSLRTAFAHTFSATERERFTRAIANQVFDGATGDSLTIFDGKDLRAEPRVAFKVTNARPTSRSGRSDILTLPLTNHAVAGLVAELEARGKRRFPIDAEQVIGALEDVEEFRVTLPPGWRAQLPPSVNTESPFGAYQATYEQNGRELKVIRRMRGSRGIHPPDRITDLIAWLKDVTRDDVKYVVIDRP